MLVCNQTPDWAVVVTMWRAAGNEAAVAGVAVVPGVSIRTKPRLAPVRLPRPKPDPAIAANTSKALKRRVQTETDTGSSTSDKILGDKSGKKKVAAPVKLSAKDATTLLRAALVRRAELLALVRPTPPSAARDDGAGIDCGVETINDRTCDCWRLVHGTGDGFDGLTSDILGLDGSGKLRVLVEAHHKWADPAPLIAAIRALADEGLLPHATVTEPRQAEQGVQDCCRKPNDSSLPPRAAVYLKMRFLADARQSGGLLAEGSTELPVPARKRHCTKKEKRKKARLEQDQIDIPEQETDSATGSIVDSPDLTPASSQEEETSARIEKESDSGCIVCSEDGLKFELSITRGEHIGLFLDSRTARAKVRELAAGRRVLNLFAFTGGAYCILQGLACHWHCLQPLPRILFGRR